jgi:hypothetical protein
MNSQIECGICLHTVRVPVQLICFPCHRQAKGKPGCNAARRVCVTCARDFLQLNRPKNQRDYEKKCLMCPVKVNPRYLASADQVYTKDYMLMSLDKKTDYTCFHEDKGCTFQGTQNELDRHLQQDCLFRMTSCPCGKMYRLNDEATHRQTCQYFKECPKCKELCDIDKYSQHLFEKHNLVKCAHVECDHLCSTENQIQHMEKECKFRMVPCSHCKVPMRSINLAQHIAAHIHQHQTEMDHLVTRMMECRQRLNECVDLYAAVSTKL